LVGGWYFLACRVHDFGDEGFSVCVGVLEDIGGDFNQERVEDALVPTSKYFGNLSLWHLQAPFHEIVSLLSAAKLKEGDLADQLHVTILDPVVDHLDVMSGTFLTDPVAAGLTIGLRRDGLEDLFDVGPCVGVATGHQGGTVTSTLFTSRNTSPNKQVSTVSIASEGLDPLSARYLQRRLESGKWELPPSMMISPNH
jgi:hypothetical protein